jgi:hypothetical protein
MNGTSQVLRVSACSALFRFQYMPFSSVDQIGSASYPVPYGSNTTRGAGKSGRKRARAGEGACVVRRLLTVLSGEMKRTEIQEKLEIKHEDYFREAYLLPALKAALIEMTVPDKPRSSKQRYRITESGRKALEDASRKIE